MSLSGLKDKLIRKICLKTWGVWEVFGLHLIPNHFYWPIGDTKKLERYDFERTFPLDGIDLDLGSMRNLAGRLGAYRDEYEPIHVECGYASNGDGAILYGMIRELNPGRVIEVGSGYSTTIIDHAIKKNASELKKKGKIISIEPFPKPVLRDIARNSMNVELIEKKVEEVDSGLFQELKEGDVLFIDSSHVVDIGNDVHYLYLYILPTLPVGTVVHIHDIRFPYEYPKEWVIDAKKFWSEQYLLQMFLAFNDSYEVLFASNYCYQESRETMSNAFVGLSENGKGWPGSFWIRRYK